MNRDKVNDVYYGRAGQLAHQRRTRERIHWICRHVEGADVLDIGCSQGIACILLGREGMRVTGIDHELEAIEDARKELVQEDPSVQERVRFEYVEATELPFDAASLDSVILAEVIEHLVQPERVLEEAERVLRDHGVLVMSIPYGLHEHHDHKDAIYLQTLRRLLAPSFVPETVEMLGPYLMVVARKGGTEAPDLPERWLAVAETRVRDLDLELARTKETLEQVRAYRDRLKEELATQKEAAREARLRAVRAERALNRTPLRLARRIARKLSGPK